MQPDDAVVEGVVLDRQGRVVPVASGRGYAVVDRRAVPSAGPTCHPLCMVWGRKSYILHEGDPSIPLDGLDPGAAEISKHFEIGSGDRDRDFSRPAGPWTPRPVPIPLPAVTDCHGS